MENSNLHLEIRKARIKQGLSQKELGEMVGLPQQAINRIEQGQRKLDVELFEKLCKSLNIKKIGSFTVNFISSYYKMDVGDDPICPANELEDDFPTDDSLYENSNSYASSEEEFNKLQKERQIESEPKKHNNVHKYDGSIRVDVSSSIKAQEIENKIKNNETISKEELSWLNDYRSSHNLKEGLGKLALSLDGVIKSLSDSMAILYDQLNENGQEKVFEYAKDLTQIPEYQKKPPEPPQE